MIFYCYPKLTSQNIVSKDMNKSIDSNFKKSSKLKIARQRQITYKLHLKYQRRFQSIETLKWR